MVIKSQHDQVYSHVWLIPHLAACIRAYRPISPALPYLCSPLAKVRSRYEATGLQAQITLKTKGHSVFRNFILVGCLSSAL